MYTRLAGQIVGITVLATAVTLGVSAQSQSQFQSRGTQASAAAAPIRLRAATFTPVRGERPAIPDGMMARSDAAGRRGYYIVQFEGPIEEAWKSAVVAAGADVLDYIPEFALKVRMNPGDAAQVARVPHVVWVGQFHPAYKLPPDVLRDAQVRPYVVRVERGASVNEVVAGVNAAGARVLRRDAQALIVGANAAQLDAVAHVLDVASIESFVLRQKHNEFGGNIMRADLAAAAGYDGSTQTIAVSDTGLGGGTAATAHRDLQPSRVTGIFNWPGATDFCFESVTPDGPLDVDTGHGTHVSTSAVGAGDANGVGRGTAPASRLVFQAIEDFVMPSFFCQFLLGLTPGYYLAGIPADVADLYQQSYDAGARIHSNSWGSAVNGAYSADSASTDAFVWTHRDLAITISAGNSGVDANADGVVDATSVYAPGTAKNVITVGASEGDRASDYECDASVGSTCGAQGGQNAVFTYGAAFGASFSANPLKDDPSAGNREQMAAFSSRGPTADGRIKPDVVAPGTWILSGYSDRYQQFYDANPNPQNGAFQYDGWGEPLNDKYKYMGGTSMSAPLVAGAAAVVRDYYQKARAHAASAALVKATLVNSAVDLLDENNDGVSDNAFPIPNIHEGWGRVDLSTATDGSREFVDESVALLTADTSSHPVVVDASGRPLRVTLAWTDAPSTTSAAKNLVNDLDLELVAPDGTLYRGNAFLDGWTIPNGAADRTNNVENVYVAAPMAGEWTVVVRGFNVPQGPQTFALVTGREATPVQQLARVSVLATDATATEANLTSGTFTLTRGGDLSQELTVSYVVTGTASAGADFVPLSGLASFAAGAADVLVTVQPVDDRLVEPGETVVLTILPGDTYGVRAPSSATVNIVSDDQPGDLVVSAVTVPATAAGGAMIVIGDTTRNQGTWPTQPSQTGFYLSANSAFDSGDYFLGSRAVPSLNAASADTGSITVTIPASAAGTYYIFAKADWNASVPETSENNNTRISTSLRVGPDLTVSSILVPAKAAAGGTISVTDTTRNDGVQAAAGSVTAFYLSSNTFWDASDTRLGARPVSALGAGLVEQGSTNVIVPATTLPGSYYIIARADDTALVTEAVETNNTRQSTTVKVGADLVVSSVSGPSAAAPGSTLQITDTTANQGAAPAASFKTAFYLSTNTVFDTNDTRLGERTITSLDAGLSNSATTMLEVPASLAPGMYYLIANADDTNAVIEPVEYNNTRVAPFQLKLGADLMIVSLAAPPTGGAGASLSITDNVKNIGGARSTPAEAVFYLSANTTFDGTDTELARRSIGPLDPGMTDSASTVVTVPANTTVGTYYVIEIVDPADVVDEATETNNSYRSGTVRIGPDLMPLSVSAPFTVVAGSTVTVSDLTKNMGGGAAGASTTSFYLSTNSALDASDTLLGNRAVPPLAAGAASSFSGPITIPAGQPAGTYYLIANANEGLAVTETSTTNNTVRFSIKVTQP